MPSGSSLTRRRALVLAASAASTAAARAQAPQILRCYPSGPIYDYRWRLLNLALSRSGSKLPRPGLQAVAGDTYSQSRAMRELQEGRLDVLAFGTNAEREQRLRPVRIDLLRGLVGMRLMLIRRGDQARIAAMDPQDLRNQLRFGLNKDWGDLAILRANNFKVLTADGYENLFAMLASGRFDAFTRGLNEAGRELAQFGQRHPELVIESSKALYFSYPIYFWVRKSDQALADRIEAGLKTALEDGSFKDLFDSHHEREIRFMAQQPREVILLRSDTLPPGFVEPDTSWWWPRRLPTSR